MKSVEVSGQRIISIWKIIGEAVTRCVRQSIASLAEIAANIWLLPVKLIVSGSCGCQE